INVFRAERDGFRLSAARTLSYDRSYRQLSVRRLITMLRLVLDRQAQWVVFEPNTTALRTRLHSYLVTFLGELYRGGAFAGDSEDESFFVRSDDSLNPPASLDLGRLVIEVGVAPAEPLEFLVLRISRDGDGGVRVTADGDG
ncbi:MAG: phage tail sheath C-terminal domain-containing protein, partial [Pseudonocardiaceae bacterium]